MFRASIPHLIDRAFLARLADGLAVAVAFSLPWSTSATSILVTLWLLALIPTLSWTVLRRELLSPAGGLPVLLIAFGIIGMAWAEVALYERWEGLDSFVKLIAVPLLICQFAKSGRGQQVFIAFLVSCIVLLIASYMLTFFPEFPWKTSRDPGVMVKSYIVQSIEFTLCAAALLNMAVEAAILHRWLNSGAYAALAIAFLFDIFFIATSRTALVVIGVLALAYGARRYGWKGFVAAGVVGVVVAGILWATSPYLRHRVTGILSETVTYETKNISTPSGERLEFWMKSLDFIKSAPLIGHGTGSIPEMFRRAAVGKVGVRAEVSTNPHNQTFAVAIQLGLFGTALLWGMWISHLLVFRGSGLVAWIGMTLVIQSIVGCLFNSFLFDFTEGWIYVFGFGVAAGMMRRQFDRTDSGIAGAGKVPAR